MSFPRGSSGDCVCGAVLSMQLTFRYLMIYSMVSPGALSGLVWIEAGGEPTFCWIARARRIGILWTVIPPDSRLLSFAAQHGHCARSMRLLADGGSACPA